MKRLFSTGNICIALLLPILGCAGSGATKDTETPQQEQQQAELVVEKAKPPPSLYYTGDGKKGMSLGIQVPAGQGLNAALSNIPSMVQGCLVHNIRKYSAITVLDPVALDKVITETLDPKYEDNLDIVRLGHVAHVGYWMTGKIIESPYGGYTLQFNITDTTPNARTLASYSGNCTASQLIDQSAVQLASIELLTQMDVKLTATAKNELSTTNTQLSIKAQSFLANSRTTERQGGNEIAVYFNAVLAAKFDPTLPEAVNRSAILAANISSERTGDNLREDVRWRNEWIARLEETERYVKNYNDYYNKYYSDYYNDFYKMYTDNWNKFIQTLPELPCTLFYAADARNYGEVNYDNNTTSYTGISAYLYTSQNWIQSVQTAIQTMDAPVAEVQRTVQTEQAAVQAAIQEVVKTVNNGLDATGQRTRWRLQPLNMGVTAVTFNRNFLENRRQKQGNQTFSVTVELVNSQNNKVIGRGSFQTSRTYSITNRGLSVSNDEQKSVNFTNVNIHDLPPSDDLLSIRIASVNGTATETAIKNGVLYIQPVNTAEWNSNPWDYTVQNGKITQYNGKDANLAIPGTILNEPVTSIKERIFFNNQQINITIHNSVTSIEERAFSNNHLTSVTIPDSVTSIGEGAFSNNHLASVTIPDSVTSIGESAFSNNPLTSVSIGANVILGSSAIGSGFEELYNRNGKLAQTYIRRDNSSTWGFDNREIDFTFDPATGTIIGYTGNTREITIPETIGGIPVTSIENGAFRFTESESVIWAFGSGNWGDTSGYFPGQTSVVINISKGVKFENSAFTGSDFGMYYARKGRKAGTYSYVYTSNKVIRNIFMGLLTPTLFGVIIPARLIPYGQWMWKFTPNK